jgi:AraC family transcriptional regulator
MRCEGSASRCEILWLDENRRQLVSELKPGSILFCPAFRRARVTKKDSGLFEFLSLRIPPSAFDLVDAGLGAAHLRLSPQVGIGQADLCRILFAMREEIENPGPAGRLYNETLALQLLIQLLRRASDMTVAPTVAKGGLSARQLRLAIELFDADATQAPSLAELAAHVGLSPTHFCTAFRQSTGHPPHRYLLNRRVARAKRLMADPGLSLTEIALSSGFGSSSQFATAFRRITGTTPSAHRRGL